MINKLVLKSSEPAELCDGMKLSRVSGIELGAEHVRLDVGGAGGSRDEHAKSFPRWTGCH